MEILTLRLRELVGNEFIVTTNGNNTLYGQCNGSTREGFPHMHGDWLANMTNPEWGYQAICTKYSGPVLSTVNTMWDGSVQGGELVRDDAFERKFTFTFASTLVYGDGYFSFDGGDGLPDHSQDWWHDWYDIDLGMSRGRSEEVTKSVEWVENASMVRRRRFERGVVVVNPTTVTQTVGLAGIYAPLAAFNGSFYPYRAMRSDVEVERQSGVLLVGFGQLPLMPAGVTWTRGESDVVSLTWEPVDGAVRYSVYKSHRPEGTLSPVFLNAVVETPSFSDTLAVWESAFYRVAPIDATGCEGSPSQVVALRPGRAAGREDPGWAGGTGTETVDDGSWEREAYPWGCAVDVDGAVELRGIDGAGEMAKETGPVRLVSCSPNPALCSTRVVFDIGSGSPPGGELVVSIYDITGRLVHRASHGSAVSGRASVEWDLRDSRGGRVAAGCYLVAVETAGVASRGKMVVMPAP